MGSRVSYKKASARKTAQLGFNVSTATARLRKMLMFDMAQKLEQDYCFRCGEQITKIHEFSVDHKIEWLDSKDPIKLFFDLDNIAFSHLSCNSVARKKCASRRLGTHGFKGIRYKKDNKKRLKPWQAQIYIHGKTQSIGYYKTPTQAAKAYDRKAVEAFGPKAVTNKSLGLL